MNRIFNTPLKDLNDRELLDVLELVSNEVKRRNTLMAASSTPPEETVKKIIESLSKQNLNR